MEARPVMLSIDESWNGKEVELAVGESFDLQLPEKRTAGYKWKSLPSDQPILTFERVKEDNVPRTAQGSLIAGGGRPGHWQGHAVQEGTAVLELHYEGPTKQLADKFQIKVHVKPR
jgi:predicted secreted protein